MSTRAIITIMAKWPSRLQSWTSIRGLHNSPPLSTVVLDRTYPAKFPKNATMHDIRKKMNYDSLKDPELRYETFAYDPLEEEQATEPVTLILLRNTDDFGPRGQIVTVIDPEMARDELLLTGKAVYATKRNLDRYKDMLIKEVEAEDAERPARSLLAMKKLRRLCLAVGVSAETEWELQPWHLRTCFQRQGYEVKEEAIDMGNLVIKGPNPELEAKEFLIHLKLNEVDRVPLRCVLFHWGIDSEDYGGSDPYFNLHFYEPMFEEQREALLKLPREPFGEKALKDETMRATKQRFDHWQIERERNM